MSVVDVSRLAPVSSDLCFVFSQSVWVGVTLWADVCVYGGQHCSSVVALFGMRASYRPSDGGSLPPEPDWARLM